MGQLKLSQGISVSSPERERWKIEAKSMVKGLGRRQDGGKMAARWRASWPFEFEIVLGVWSVFLTQVKFPCPKFPTIIGRGPEQDSCYGNSCQ